MKNLIYLLTAAVLFASCTASKEGSQTKAEKKAANAVAVRKAVESRQYVIKMDKILPQVGSPIDIIPRSNFFIMNGEIASVSLAYVGRSYFSRPISGINFNGHTVKYILSRNSEKGLYEIQVVVQLGNDKFDFYITIGDSGFCDVTVNNANIQTVGYRGTLVPLKKTEQGKPDPAAQAERL